MRVIPRATSLTCRSTQAEWLDGAGTDSTELKAFLCDLARFNGNMLGHWPILAWLRRAIVHAPDDRPLTLIDVGCGYGDLLRAIRRWARKVELAINLIGLDLSRETIAIAREATDAADTIDYQVGDVLADRVGQPVDFVVSSLLTHHFSDSMIVDFLRWMERTMRRGWLIYDLQRHAVPYAFIGLMGKMTRLNPTMIDDGRISVARSLTRTEWQTRIAAAGIPREAVVLLWFLYRFVIGRLRAQAIR